ncbi:minor tail protein [Gordonia phage RedWattleHog]|uniref:Minor tail protein n=1 Tax=Gordonia phage Stormageddon TaxID=2656541 RepID=A0A649VSD7_9CAUD|nr:virion structural protein [Gordonia phage Stormageddon]QGJ94915.1 minor tail protein [Gordonia phage Stormageddon]QLF83559.1 minor tail protein [Gordonia phage RedWattleHog]
MSDFPLLPPKSIEARLAHFDETVYRADSSTVLYKLLDALCGDAGAGDLKKGAFLRRLSQSLENVYFSDLDYIFGGMGFLSRSSEETYPYDPTNDMLTSDQWDEVRVKDAWYRARIRDFFIAAGKGGTPQGIRLACMAATSVDCDIHEVWRYLDNFGISAALGRSPVSTRNEFVVRPHKASLTEKEKRLLLQMLNRIAPADTVVTVNTGGLAVHTPIIPKTAAADSSYFEVQKVVTGTPILAELPPPELLAIDLRPSEKWLLSGDPSTAPYAAFNITQEYGYYYLASGGARSPVDSVLYGTLADNGAFKPETNFESFQVIEQFTAWMEYDRADSPDNFPGGKFGLTPDAAPAKNPDGTPYVFRYESQQEFVNKVKAEVISGGGEADDLRYRLPIIASSSSKKTFTPDLAVAWNPPTKDSTVTKAWTSGTPYQASATTNHDNPWSVGLNLGLVP